MDPVNVKNSRHVKRTNIKKSPRSLPSSECVFALHYEAKTILFTEGILTANGFSESPAKGFSSKPAIVKLPLMFREQKQRF